MQIPQSSLHKEINGEAKTLGWKTAQSVQSWWGNFLFHLWIFWVLLPTYSPQEYHPFFTSNSCRREPSHTHGHVPICQTEGFSSHKLAVTIIHSSVQRACTFTLSQRSSEGRGDANVNVDASKLLSPDLDVDYNLSCTVFRQRRKPGRDCTAARPLRVFASVVPPSASMDKVLYVGLHGRTSKAAFHCDKRRNWERVADKESGVLMWMDCFSSRNSPAYVQMSNGGFVPLFSASSMGLTVWSLSARWAERFWYWHPCDKRKIRTPSLFGALQKPWRVQLLHILDCLSS